MQSLRLALGFDLRASTLRGGFIVVLSLVLTACSGGSNPNAPTAVAPVAQRTATADTAVPSSPAPEAIAAEPGPVSSGPLRIEPDQFVGGTPLTGTITLTTPAPVGGVVVSLSSSDRDVRPPASVTVPAGTLATTFIVSTSEPHGDTAVRITATVGGVAHEVTVRLLLSAPGARPDEYQVASGNTLVVRSPGVLDNDTRRAGHDLTAVLRTGPMSGTLTLQQDGGFTYRPNSGFTGRDRFIYVPMDGATAGGAQHAWITVTATASTAPVTTPPPAPTGSQTFSYTGASQTFTVPAGVTQITIDASGAEGGAGIGTIPGVGGAAGSGGRVEATIAVVAGTTYQVIVGGQGGSVAPRPGGGGGASDVRSGAYGLSDRVIVAGGGGGGGGADANFGGAGGAGGGFSAGAGALSSDGSIPGSGGTQIAGGAAGGGPDTGMVGASGAGGDGYCCGVDGGAPGFNGGGQGGPRRAGGAGGGGYFGGGGGSAGPGSQAGSGGGGGSSFTAPAATGVTHQQGVRSGNGVVIIRW